MDVSGNALLPPTSESSPDEQDSVNVMASTKPATNVILEEFASHNVPPFWL